MDRNIGILLNKLLDIQTIGSLLESFLIILLYLPLDPMVRHASN